MNTHAVTLTIDSSHREEILVAIEKGGKRFEKTSSSKTANAQNVLPLVEALLVEHGIALKHIAQIRVHTGPGSFTGLRVGIAVANALAALLAVPINGQPVGQLAIPRYETSTFDELSV